jgi:hypothetical protein
MPGVGLPRKKKKMLLHSPTDDVDEVIEGTLQLLELRGRFHDVNPSVVLERACERGGLVLTAIFKILIDLVGPKDRIARNLFRCEICHLACRMRADGGGVSASQGCRNETKAMQKLANRI